MTAIKKNAKKTNDTVKLYIKLMNEAEKYPLSLRIAAKWIRSGYTEENWHELHFKFVSGVPMPIVNQIQNNIRDITVTHLYKLEEIPVI